MMNIKQLKIILIFAVSTSLAALQSVQANPKGATVVNGQVSFSNPDLNTLIVNNSRNAIINWQAFDIGVNELTRFVQQGGSSAVLNRVISGNASEILGKLQSNGKVFLINPNGLVIGQNAVINTAGFIGSTLNISNEDFLNGRLHFEGQNAGDIDNQGFIRAGSNGDILLIAPNISNSGILQVDGGNILLAAGESITISSLDDADISFEVQSPDNSITNLGQVIADNGAANLFASTLTHTGSISANGITRDSAGNIRLVAQDTNWIEGEVIATGKTGGEIQLLGEQVGLSGNAMIDASGTEGGGQVLVGGDYQGLGDVQTARATYVGENVQIKADAVEQGDGGRVIVWSDEATRMYGGIRATGGALSGDGGFIETSGGWFELGNNVPDASAANGEAGTWLIDPNNIDIISGTGGNISAGPIFTSTGEPASIDVGQITAALANADVVIQTGTAAPDSEAGDINWGAGVLLDLDDVVNRTLTLRAHNDVNIAGDITRQGGISEDFSLIIIADSDGNNSGGFTLANTASLDLGFAPGFVGTLDVTASSNIILDGNVATNGGNINLSTTNGSISQGFASAIDADTIDMSAATGISLAGSIDTGSAGGDSLTLDASSGTILQSVSSGITTSNLVASAAGDMDYQGGNTIDNLNAVVNSGSNLTFFNTGALTIDAISAVGGTVAINNSGGVIDQVGAIGGITADKLDITADSNINLSDSNTVAKLSIITNTGSDVTFNNGGTNLSIEGITDISVGSLGTVTIINENDINQAAGAGSEIRTDTLNVTAGGDVDLTNDFNAVSNLNVVTSSGGDFSIKNNVELTTGAINVDGDARIEAQSLTIAGLFNSVGNTQLVSTSGGLFTQNSITSSAGNVELIADDFAINNMITANNQVVIREYSAANGIEINDASTPSIDFARLTTTDLAFLEGTNLGIVLGNDLAHTGVKTIQVVSKIDSSMINGSALTFDTTNNSSGFSLASINADIDFTAGNENLIFTGNGSASIQSVPAIGDVLVDTGNGNLSANVSQFLVLATENNQVMVKTNNSDITGNLFVDSGTLAGSSANFEGNNLTVVGDVNVTAIADSAEINFSGDVDISSAQSVTVFGGQADNAFAKLVGGNIDITADNTSVFGGDGANAIAEIASTTGGSTTIDSGSGTILLSSGSGVDADALIVGGGGAGVVSLQFATCQECDNQLLTDPNGNGVSDSGVFARTVSLNNQVTSTSNDGNLDPIPELDSLFKNFAAEYIPPVSDDDEDDEDLLICR